MSTLDPKHSAPPRTEDTDGAPPAAAAPPGATAPSAKRRNPWIWACGALVLAAVGLLIWGLTTQADLDSSQDEVSDLQAQVRDESAESEAAKDVADELAQDLGASNEDLAATEQQLSEAEQSAQQAEDTAAAAKKDVEQAQDATAKAEAEAKEAKAEAEAVQTRGEIAGDCARAYVTAFGSLFEGESVKSQAAAVREELQGISAKCQSALSGE